MISVVIAILIVELYAWLPKLSEWLVELAVQRLRSEDQDRCREEWKAGLDALPNTVIKFVHALSYLGAAHRINAEFFESRLTEINALIEECGRKQSCLVVLFRAEIERLGRSREDLDVSLSDLRTLVMEAPNKEVASSFAGVVTMAETCASKIGRSTELVTVALDRVIESSIKNLIIRASEKRNQVTELLGRRDAAPDVLDTLVAELASALHTVENIFENDKWGDNVLKLRRSKRLSVLVEEAMRSSNELARAVLMRGHGDDSIQRVRRHQQALLVELRSFARREFQ